MNITQINQNNKFNSQAFGLKSISTRDLLGDSRLQGRINKIASQLLPLIDGETGLYFGRHEGTEQVYVSFQKALQPSGDFFMRHTTRIMSDSDMPSTDKGLVEVITNHAESAKKFFAGTQSKIDAGETENVNLWAENLWPNK